MKKFIVLLAVVYFPTLVAAQTPSAHSAPTELGLPFIRNYSPKEYGAHAQNWTIAQDSRGVMYFGNGIGVVEYDGVSWRLIQFPNCLYALCPPLSYAHNNLRFAYSASSFEDASRLQFQTWLEGFDESRKAGSNWNDKTEKEYTNLPEGDYQFRVRAKNIYEHESQEAVYAFTILPPWYRTWWAYGGYAVIFGLLVFAADRVQRRRLLKKRTRVRGISRSQIARRGGGSARKNG